MATKWTPSFENYTFGDRGRRNRGPVDLDVEDEHAEVFEGMWPEALRELKELAER